MTLQDRYYNQLRRYVREKSWLEAYEMSQLIDQDIGWLKSHIQECARLVPKWRSQDTESDAQNRLTSCFPGCKLIQSDRLKGGKVSFILYKHRLCYQGQEIHVVEKVFVKSMEQMALLEEKLFKFVDHNLLSAPAFYGLYINDDFTSAFYQYIDGDPVKGRLENETCATDVLLKLWNVVPPNDVIECNKEIDFVDRFYNNFNRFSSLYPDLGDARNKILVLTNSFRDLPKRIIHQDILGNMIKALDDDDPESLSVKEYKIYLIDWDKWFISSIGSGVQIDTLDFERLENFVRRIYKGVLTEIFETEAALLQAILIDNLSRAACAKKDKSVMKFWLQAVYRYS